MYLIKCFFHRVPHFISKKINFIFFIVSLCSTDVSLSVMCPVRCRYLIYFFSLKSQEWLCDWDEWSGKVKMKEWQWWVDWNNFEILKLHRSFYVRIYKKRFISCRLSFENVFTKNFTFHKNSKYFSSFVRFFKELKKFQLYKIKRNFESCKKFFEAAQASEELKFLFMLRFQKLEILRGLIF